MGAHILWPPGSTIKKPEELVYLDGWGRASIISADDIEWNVGEEKALPLMAVMQERTKRIETQVTKLQELLQALGDRLGGARSNGLSDITSSIAMGEMEKTFEKVSSFRQIFAPSTVGVQGMAVLDRVEALLADLIRLKEDQTQDRKRMRTPDRYVVFWMSPPLVLAEVAWWALFGVFTSVLYHAGQFVAKNEFRAAEEVVATTKLLYAPVIGVVMALSLWGGIITFSGPTSRVWVTPVLAFLFGFNARKAADVVDEISHKILDRFRKNQGEDAEAGAAKPRFAAYYKIMPGATLNDIRQEARELARDEILKELIQLERNA